MRVCVRKRVKNFKADQCRIIKINRAAVWEILFEYLCENEERLFDLLKATDGNVEMSMRWNADNDTFICVAHNDKERRPIDFDKIERTMKDTTESVFSGEKKYMDARLSHFEEITENGEIR